MALSSTTTSPANLVEFADNQAAAELAVVSHVNGLHQEVVAAYHGLALRGCTTRDSNVLTDAVVIAHLAGCLPRP